MNTWDVVLSLGLAVEKPSAKDIVFYGSSDPMPNPAELLPTQFVASYYGVGWKFFVYPHGRNLSMEVPANYKNPPGVFYLEDIIPNLSLRDIANEIWNLRQEPVIVAHRSDGRPIRATSKVRDIPDITITQLHQAGGWLGGSGIHWVLRRYAEEHQEVLYLCPFQEKGRVYEIYRGVGRPLFLLTPFVRFIPPSRLGLPEWAPCPWTYWLSLPAAFRRRVRKEVWERIFFSGERRIEIPLP